MARSGASGSAGAGRDGLRTRSRCADVKTLRPGCDLDLTLTRRRPFAGGLFADRTVSRLVRMILSSRHLLSPQQAVSWCPAWPRARHQRGPLPRLRLSVRSNPNRDLRTLAQPPPQPGGGLLERVCPVEAFSIVPRRLAGGCAPRPSGGDVTERRTLRPPKPTEYAFL